MACACSKKGNTPVTGFGRGGREAQKAQREGAKTQRVELTDPKGQTTIHGSRLEASAARVRAGGGTIRPV